MPGPVPIVVFQVSWEVQGADASFKDVLIESLGNNSREAVRDLFSRMAHRCGYPVERIRRTSLTTVGDDDVLELPADWAEFKFKQGGKADGPRS